MGISKSDPIIIVGASASSLSVALHLSLRGYTKISVFAKDDYIPFGDLTNVAYHSTSQRGNRIADGYIGLPRCTRCRRAVLPRTTSRPNILREHIGREKECWYPHKEGILSLVACHYRSRGWEYFIRNWPVACPQLLGHTALLLYQHQVQFPRRIHPTIIFFGYTAIGEFGTKFQVVHGGTSGCRFPGGNEWSTVGEFTSTLV